MEEVGDWWVVIGGGAISATLTTVPGLQGLALQLDYNLGTSTGAWVQLRRDFDPPLDLSAGDHLRFFHTGTTPNTLEVGLVHGSQNYFGSGWNEATHVPWWTYATWDFQDFRTMETGIPFPDLSQVSAIFISVAKKGQGVGGFGSFSIDELQYLNVASRTVPSDFEFATASPTVTQQAADWIAVRQQDSGLLESWQEEAADYSWLYDQALGLIVLSETDLGRARLLATVLHTLQNGDGSWYGGYHFLSNDPIHTNKPVGANAWMVYALMYYYWVSGDPIAYQDALECADWLAGLQREDGSLPGEPSDSGAPTEANLDAWWAFQSTGHHQAQADAVRDFLLERVWDPEMGRFKSSGNGYLDRYRILLDNQTWGASFLQAIGREADARRALSYARWTLAATSSDGSICGFDGAGPFSVWNDGTLHYVAARGENSQYYWEQMAGQQAPDGDLQGGLPGSPDEFRGYLVWLTRMHGVAPTSWLYFAGTGGPFSLPPKVGTFEADPPVGRVGGWVTFTTTYSDLNGYEDLDWAFFFLDRQPPMGEGGLAAAYYRPANILWLKGVGACQPGEPGFLGTEYITLDCSATSVSGTGDTLAINWHARPNQCFAGGCSWNYAAEYVADSVGQQDTGLVGWWRLDPPTGQAPSRSRLVGPTEADMEQLRREIEAWQSDLDNLH